MLHRHIIKKYKATTELNPFHCTQRVLDHNALSAWASHMTSLSTATLPLSFNTQGNKNKITVWEKMEERFFFWKGEGRGSRQKLARGSAHQRTLFVGTH